MRDKNHETFKGDLYTKGTIKLVPFVSILFYFKILDLFFTFFKA